MLFKYRALDKSGNEREGTIDALSLDVAVTALQRRELVVSFIEPVLETTFFGSFTGLFSPVSNREVVILSRQIATLFESQVPALRVFRLLASEVENKALAKVITEIADDVQGGSPISKALSRHEKVFSSFYINMVRAGEEAGKLSET